MGDALEVAIETAPIVFVVGTNLRPEARPNQLLIQEQKPFDTRNLICGKHDLP